MVKATNPLLLSCRHYDSHLVPYALITAAITPEMGNFTKVSYGKIRSQYHPYYQVFPDVAAAIMIHMLIVR